MKRLRRPFLTFLLLFVATSLQGCIGFSGPNGIRNAIAQSQDVRLEKEFGVDVGPLGIALASAIAAPHMPFSLDGLAWVSVGQYTIKPHEDGSYNTFSLDYLELNGWQTFVRVREEGSNIKLMCNSRGKHLNKLLAVVQENNELIIAKIEGDFEKIMENALNSEMFDDVEIFGGGHGWNKGREGRCDVCEHDCNDACDFDHDACDHEHDDHEGDDWNEPEQNIEVVHFLTAEPVASGA